MPLPEGGLCGVTLLTPSTCPVAKHKSATEPSSAMLATIVLTRRLSTPWLLLKAADGAVATGGSWMRFTAAEGAAIRRCVEGGL